MAVVGLMAASYAVGEFVRPVHKVEMKYKTEFLPAEDNFYNGKSSVEYVINDNNKVETYLINDNQEKFPLLENISGEPKVGSNLYIQDHTPAKDFFDGELELSYALNENKQVEVYLVNRTTNEKFPIKENNDQEPTVNSIDNKIGEFFKEQKEHMSSRFETWKKEVSDWYDDNFTKDSVNNN